MDSSDDNSDYCEDDEMQCFNYTCLMCESSFTEIEEMTIHILNIHNINLKHILKSVRISNEYDWIKIINFIRKHNVNIKIDDIENELWQSEEYLKPVINDDNLLFIDYKNVFQINSSENNDRIMELEYELSKAAETIALLRNKIKDLTDCCDNEIINPVIDQGELQKTSKLNEEDQAYFSSYSHYSIHSTMLNDKIRTESYRKFIEENGRDYFRNKIVLDIGCGTGILSMFAARAGAAHVYGIDCADVIYDAMAIVEKNGLKDRITLIHGKLEDTELPCNKVDVVISEWMGYFLIYESMLDSVVFGCRRYLDPGSGGRVFPGFFTLNVVGADFRAEYVDCWPDVFGFDMSVMKPNVMREVIIDVVPHGAVVTDSCSIRDYDVQEIAFGAPGVCPQLIEREFELTAVKSGRFGAVVAYFDTFFVRPDQQSDGVMFSTGPHVDATHWKQTIMLLNQPFDVVEGEKIRGFISVGRHSQGKRGLDFSLTINNNAVQKYEFS